MNELHFCRWASLSQARFVSLLKTTGQRSPQQTTALHLIFALNFFLNRGVLGFVGFALLFGSPQPLTLAVCSFSPAKRPVTTLEPSFLVWELLLCLPKHDKYTVLNSALLLNQLWNCLGWEGGMAPTAFTTLSFSVLVCLILIEFGIRAEHGQYADNSRRLHFKITFELSHSNRIFFFSGF